MRLSRRLAVAAVAAVDRLRLLAGQVAAVPIFTLRAQPERPGKATQAARKILAGRSNPPQAAAGQARQVRLDRRHSAAMAALDCRDRSAARRHTTRAAVAARCSIRPAAAAPGDSAGAATADAVHRQLDSESMPRTARSTRAAAGAAEITTTTATSARQPTAVAASCGCHIPSHFRCRFRASAGRPISAADSRQDAPPKYIRELPEYVR